jgi:hypothetical protein
MDLNNILETIFIVVVGEFVIWGLVLIALKFGKKI